MTAPEVAARRRAERIVRLYPKAWQVRYRDEFVELLIDDITERPHSWHRLARRCARHLSA